MPTENAPRPIVIVSDGTGLTAENVVRAALCQFRTGRVPLQILPNVSEAEQLDRIMRRASQSRALVVTTLVRPDMREQARRLSNEHRIPMVDLIGSLLGQLGAWLGAQPDNVPGRRHGPGADYFRRTNAIEFAVHADEARDLSLLGQADLVLVGLPNTSKTPLAIALAQRGLKVANLPVLLEQPLPDELFAVDQKRVVGLTADPDHLQVHRRASLADGVSQADHAELRYVLAEVEWAEGLFRRNPEWPVVDVTHRTVEQIAATVVKILGERGLGPDAGGAEERS